MFFLALPALSLLLLSVTQTPVGCSELYISTDSAHSCPPPAAVCHTLQQYAQDSPRYFASDTIFHFLPGKHMLNISILVEHVDNLTLTVSNSSATTRIACEENLTIGFFNTSNLIVDGLEFSNCGGLETSQPALSFDSVTRLTLNGLTLHNSKIRDIIGHNVNDLTIFNCSFGTLPIAPEEVKFSHHLRLTFDNETSQSSIMSVARITDCHFYSSSRGAVHVSIEQPRDPVMVYIDNISILGPFTEGQVLGVAYRAAVLVHMNSTLNHTVQITNSRLLDSRSRAMIFSMYSNASILLQNCTIARSKGGALALDVGYPDLSSLEFVIDNLTISNNSLYGDTGAGSAIVVKPEQKIGPIQSRLEIRNSIFENNVHIDTLGLVQSTIYLADVRDITFSDCRFISNKATAILVARSTIHVSGYMEFFNNTGYQGGACALYGDSQIAIDHNNTVLNFTQNQASNVGGALFVLENFVPFTQPLPNPCFFRYEEEVHNTTFLFVNNTAVNGGNAIYGESIENCSTGNNGIGGYTGGEMLGWPTFVFQPDSSTDISVISSEPSRVCVCENGQQNCSLAYISKSVIPGQDITMPVVTVGNRFGAVSGSVFAAFMQKKPGHIYHIAEEDKVTPTSALECTDVNYTIASSASSAIVTLTSASVIVPYLDRTILDNAIANFNTSRLIHEIFLSYPVYVNVSFLECPLGSHLNNESHTCDCVRELTENDVSCNILNQTVTLPGGLWVNASFTSSGEPNGILARPCVLQYCLMEENTISLEEPDTQCAFCRVGTLCGGCQAGLSLTLGSPTCRVCSNNYLSLLTLFLANGFFLVFFIKLLSLTVAEGTINGLIFYANIVWANKSLFFDTGDASFPLVFIAWLNLDMGVTTCFFDGLKMYSLTWLQYAFPAYIWILALLFIVLAHYSSRLAKILGRNSVPVLATLFLLTYNKILRNIINSLNVSQIELPNLEHSSKLVWTYDGNFDYLGSSHVYLFAVAVLLLLFAWLPYTATLLFGQCLMRLPNNRFSRYLKPFLDAYYGPLLDRYRFWIGLLLLLRSVILLVFALNPQNTGAVDLLVILLTALLLIYILTRWGYIYKNKYVAQLEVSFFFNLAVLAGVQMYATVAGHSWKAATQTSVLIVFVKFVLILLYHIYRQLRNFEIVQGFETKVMKLLPNEASETSMSFVRTISISDSLQIESTSNETDPSNSSPGIRRYLSRTNRMRSTNRNTSSRSGRHANTASTGSPNTVSYSVVMGDSMETSLTQVRGYNSPFGHGVKS